MGTKCKLAGLFVLGMLATGCQSNRPWDNNTGYPTSGGMMGSNFQQAQQPMNPSASYARSPSTPQGQMVQQAGYQQPMYQHTANAGVVQASGPMSYTSGGQPMAHVPASGGYQPAAQRMPQQQQWPAQSAQQATTGSMVPPPQPSGYHTIPATNKVPTMPGTMME